MKLHLPTQQAAIWSKLTTEVVATSCSLGFSFGTEACPTACPTSARKPDVSLGEVEPTAAFFGPGRGQKIASLSVKELNQSNGRSDSIGQLHPSAVGFAVCF